MIKAAVLIFGTVLGVKGGRVMERSEQGRSEQVNGFFMTRGCEVMGDRCDREAKGNLNTDNRQIGNPRMTADKNLFIIS